MPNSGTQDDARGANVLDVLVVDDEQMVLSVIERIVEAHGHRVRVANGGRQALEALKILASNLVITDIRMPGMDGLELAQQVRAGYPSTGLALMTGYSFDKFVQAAMELNVDAYLKKPFKARELTQLLDRITQQPP